MKSVSGCLTIALFLCASGNSQPQASPKLEFEAAAINLAAPQTGHFRAPGSIKGGPGTEDPTLFRCTNCDLAFLITKAFELQRYQFPGQSSLPDAVYNVSARVPESATPQQFAMMLQNLLKDRFGLAYHLDKKDMQGYELVVSKNGPKLKESTESPVPPGARPEADGNGFHGAWNAGGSAGGHDHSRPGLMVFGGQGKFLGDHQTMGDLARIISNQLVKPVDDHTGLQGKYDISLTWSDDGSHAAGAPGHGDHGDGAPGGFGANLDRPAAPTLIGAVQSQLGLKLEPRKATATLFIIDRIDKTPTAN